MKKRIPSKKATNGSPTDSVTKRDERGTAMSTLLLFARHRTLTSQQIAGLLRIPVSTVYRHLQTLLQAGFVVENPVIGRYSAGPEVVRLADNYRQEASAQGVVRRRLEQLSAETGELAAYMVQSSLEVICVDSVESIHILSCSYAPGRSRPLLHGASARAIMAHLPAREVDDIITSHSLTPADEQAIRSDLEQIRSGGYATSQGALAPGVWGASAPVFNDSTLAGVVTTMVPVERATTETERNRYINLTRQAARDLS
ncbi:IclR family transcriptional regulator [Paenarthrobacter sp. NPDC058040]|uniref:IclR family transcriptional regulator n=1 Tax=unclassified Paenarthrobacter TaxID=2634190 RepID=UPI0036DE37B9